MKNTLLFIVVSILAVGLFTGLKYLFPTVSNQTGLPPGNKPSPPVTSSSPCKPNQLEAKMTSEGAAGNMYVTVTLKNISQTACNVIGNNQLQIQYPNSVRNFKIEVRKPPTKNLFSVAPGQVIYSLIHYPNGPQCSANASFVNTGVSYAISMKETVSFKPSTGDTLDIPSCANDKDITRIDLYSFSDKEVSP